MDIDLDFPNRDNVLKYFKHIRASVNDNTVHNTGVYVQSIPYNPFTNTSTINYNEAEKRGYFKIDFLNVNLYNQIKDENQLIRLMNTEPIWDLLLHDEFVNMLFHVNGYGDVLRIMKPQSVEQLAAVLAMIRPAKKHLIGKDWDTVMQDIWQKPTNDKYFFKKGHAISYAILVIVQMNLICESV